MGGNEDVRSEGLFGVGDIGQRGGHEDKIKE